MNDAANRTGGAPAEAERPRDRHLFGKGPKRLLALDGGGVRGAITVAFLERIEQILAEEHAARRNNEGAPASGPPAPPIRLADVFDLVGGTSTGAIIAGALALGRTTAEIKEFYLELAPRVFRRPPWRIPFVQAKFDARALSDEIHNIVQERTLDDPELITGLAVITKRLDTGSPWILANNRKAPYWEDKAPTAADKGHIGNKHYKLANLVRASTAAPHYFDPEILPIIEDVRSDPLGDVKANLTGFPIASFLLTKMRAWYGLLLNKKIDSDTHGLFVDGGVTPHNNPAMALLMMTVLKPFGICWPLGVDNLSIFSIGTGSHRTKVTLRDVRWAGPLGLALGALLSLMSDNDYLTLAQMQWLGECMTWWTVDGERRTWTINSEIDSLAGETPPGGPWFRFARYDVRLEARWLADNLGFDLTDKEVARFHRMDDPGIVKCIYAIARLAAERQVRREHFFPESRTEPAAAPAT